MKRLFLILLLIVVMTGCGESMKEKEEKAERLRRESQALLAELTKGNAKESEKNTSNEDPTPSKEPRSDEKSTQPESETPPASQEPDPSASAKSEKNDKWKNPYANYSDYKESPLNIAIKKRYEELFADREKNPNYDISATQEQIQQYEKECDRIVSEEFGITPKEASEIYVKSVLAATTNSKAQFDIFEYLKKYFSEEALPINISGIEINRDLSKAEEIYIVLIHADYLQKNRPENANAEMSIIAQNIAIHLQLMEKVEFSDLVFFFRDDYNQRDLKLTAEWDTNFRGFFKTGIWY